MQTQEIESFKIFTDFSHHLKRIKTNHDQKTLEFIFQIPDNLDLQEKQKRQKEITDHIERIFGPILDSSEIFYPEFNPQNNTNDIIYKLTDPDKINFAVGLVNNYVSYQNLSIKTSLEKALSSVQKLLGVLGIKNKFSPGDRTVMHLNNLNKPNGYEILIKDLKKENQNNSWAKAEICSGNTNFADLKKAQIIASVGTKREVIILDTNSEYMDDIYIQYRFSIENEKSLSNIFKFSIDFSQKKLGKYNEEKLKDYIGESAAEKEVMMGEVTSQQKILSINECISNQIGVCRHRALLAAYLLGRYVKEHKLENVSVHHCREGWQRKNSKGQLENIAHTWVVWKDTTQNNEKLYIIDPTWEKQFDLMQWSDYQIACQNYTQAVVDKTLERADMLPPQKAVVQKQKVKISLEISLQAELAKRSKASISEIKNLLNQGAKVDTINQSTGWSVLHVAVFHSDKNLLKLILDKITDQRELINLLQSKTANSGCCPLGLMTDPLMLEMLLKKLTDFKIDPQHTVLQEILNHALKKQLEGEFSFENIKSLIENGADILTVNTENKNVLDIALEKNNNELVEYCLQAHSKKSEKTYLEPELNDRKTPAKVNAFLDKPIPRALPGFSDYLLKSPVEKYSLPPQFLFSKKPEEKVAEVNKKNYIIK